MAVPGLKVQDGLFIGGQIASQDEEALDDNKVTHIVNCCGQQTNNVFESCGITYLTFYWADTPSQVILDPADEVIDKVYNFVEEALEKSEGVLIHSFFGNSRSCCILCAYMMKKYWWSLQKTMAFLASRLLEMQMKPVFEQQLSAFELRLEAKTKEPLSTDWDVTDLGTVNSGELLLVNTYRNVKALVPLDLRPTPARTHKLKWSDDMAGDKSRLEQPPSPRMGPVTKPALKGCTVAAVVAGHNASGAAGGVITICTRAGVVKCRPEEIVHKRFGLKFDRSTIILEYCVPARGLRAHHTVKVDLHRLTSGSATCDAAAAEQLKQAHAPWLNGVSGKQLEELVGRLRSASRGAADVALPRNE